MVWDKDEGTNVFLKEVTTFVDIVHLDYGNEQKKPKSNPVDMGR